MSSDSFTPEEEAIVHDDADASDGDAWDAAERAVLASPDDQGASAEDEEPEAADESEDAEPEEGEVLDEDAEDTGSDADSEDETDEEPEQETAEADAEWDGNPETLPDTLKPKYKAMERWFHQKNRERADEQRADAAKRRELEVLVAENRALNAELKGGGARSGAASDPQSEGPPPLPTAEDDDTTFQGKMDARARYFANEQIKAAVEKGEIITRDQYEPVRAQADAVSKKAFLQSQEGFTDEVAGRMADLGDASPRYQAKLLSNSADDLLDVFEIARAQIAAEQAAGSREAAERSRAETIAAEVKSKAKAGKQAVSRPGRASVSNKVVRVPRNASLDDRFAAAERAALEE